MANPLNWQSKLIEALFVVIAIAVVARVVFGLLGPLLPGLAMLVILLGIFIFIFKRQ